MRLLRFARNDSDEEKGQPLFSEEEKILRRIPLEIIALSFFIALVSFPFFSLLTALFVLAGGGFSALSFIWLKQSVLRLFLLKNAAQKGDRQLTEPVTFLSKNGDSPYKEKGQSPFLPPSLKRALRSGLALYGLRLLLILAIFFIIILLFSKKIIAFAAGFSVIIPVFLAEAVIALSRMKQWKD